MSKFWMIGVTAIVVSVASVALQVRPVRSSDDLLGKAQAQFAIKARDALVQRRMTSAPPSPVDAAPAGAELPYVVASLETGGRANDRQVRNARCSGDSGSPVADPKLSRRPGRGAQIAGGRHSGEHQGHRAAAGRVTGNAGIRTGRRTQSCSIDRAIAGSGRRAGARGYGSDTGGHRRNRCDASRGGESNSQTAPCLERAEDERRRSSLRTRDIRVFSALQPSIIARPRPGNRRRGRPIYVKAHRRRCGEDSGGGIKPPPELFADPFRKSVTGRRLPRQ